MGNPRRPIPIHLVMLGVDISVAPFPWFFAPYWSCEQPGVRCPIVMRLQGPPSQDATMMPCMEVLHAEGALFTIVREGSFSRVRTAPILHDLAPIGVPKPDRPTTPYSPRKPLI